MVEIREEIAPFLTNPKWEVFSSDEVRIELEAETKRAWLKKGKKTILKVNRKRESQSYIGFLNQKKFDCSLYRMDWQNQEEVIKALKQFLKKHPKKKICIIWDNAAFHKGKIIRESLKKGNSLERIHLIPMPPYAPDENPIEKVWKSGKKKIANIQKNTFDETRKAFESHVRGRKFKYAM